MSDKIQELSKALNKLFSSYPQFQASDDAMGAYFEAVEPYEVVDVKNAVGDFLTGRADGFNPAFAPSAPQVGSAVRKHALDRWNEEAKARKAALPLPPPEPKPTPEEMARRREFIAEMRGKHPNLLIGVEFEVGDADGRDD